jgi:hypothetical protein
VVPLYTPSSNAALSHVSLEDLKPPPVHVLFSFISCQVVEQISEQIIAEAFLPFGILTDVNIKKHNTIGVSLVMIDVKIFSLITVNTIIGWRIPEWIRFCAV